MIADAAIAEIDTLMAYYDVRSIYTTELGRALSYEYDKRVARMIFAAAGYNTEPLNKDGTAKPKGPADNTGRVGKKITLGAGYGTATTKQAKGDILVDAIFDARVALEKKDVSIDGMYCVCTPEAYYNITASSRAINTDFNGSGGGNGTIAQGVTARVGGIPLYSSNHVQQPAYALQAGDYSPDYAQDLSKCEMLIFNRDAVGVLTLLSPSLQVTSGDWNIQHQASLLVARQAIGMGVLRAESAVAVVTP